AVIVSVFLSSQTISHRDTRPPSPTRRSSDLIRLAATDLGNHLACRHLTTLDLEVAQGKRAEPDWAAPDLAVIRERGERHEREYRSEEHTSELQSRVDLVCRLLLEKKKTDMKRNPRAARTIPCSQSHHSLALEAECEHGSPAIRRQ